LSQPRRPSVRIMTWNIHGAVGCNPRFDLAQVVKLIRRWDPDVVALQEVDSRRKIPGVENPFAVLQHALGRHGIGAKSIVTADGEYGQMLISRWPMHDTEVHDISLPEREPRRAIKTDIDTPGGPLRIVATHLGLAIRERRGQARALLDLAGATSATTVVLGDFNDWFWAGSVRSVLAGALPAWTGYRTFPSVFPLLRLDRVYCRPRQALVSSWVDRSAKHISDHLPVITEVRP
jgi:endonuclease/exonuclease/phosphatase family metal-dependent hydrolase